MSLMVLVMQVGVQLSIFTMAESESKFRELLLLQELKLWLHMKIAGRCLVFLQLELGSGPWEMLESKGPA